MQHAKYSPSSAHRWLICPESANYKSESTNAAREGQLAHAQAEQLLNGEDVEEVLPFVQDYVDYVNAIPLDSVFIEQRLNIDEDNEIFGTSDVVGFKDTTCHVIDLKYGFMAVDVEDNPQLKLYAAGVLNDFEFMDVEKFVLHIYQPRANNIAQWEVSADEIRAFLLFAKHQIGIGGYRPSEDACRWCPKRTRCPHLENYIRSQFNDTAEPDVEWVVRNASMIADWIKEVKRDACERLTKGEHVEGLKLIKGKKFKKWADPDKAPTRTEILSPAQAKKEGIEDLPEIVEYEGKPQLVTADDKRPSILEGMFDALD